MKILITQNIILDFIQQFFNKLYFISSKQLTINTFIMRIIHF